MEEKIPKHIEILQETECRGFQGKEKLACKRGFIKGFMSCKEQANFEAKEKFGD